MPKVDRYRLLGRYSTPKVRYGHSAKCAIRGEVVFCGLSDAPIPWPLGRLSRPHKGKLVVFRGLVKALRLESAVAVCHHWRISPVTLWRWRRALGIGANTRGSVALRAALRKGKPRPPHVVDAIRKAHLGTKASSETRAKMSATQKRIRASSPRGDQWTAKDDALVRKLPAGKAAKRTGRSLQAVYLRRHKLGVPDGRRRATQA
jgi:hypothetical protein